MNLISYEKEEFGKVEVIKLGDNFYFNGNDVAVSLDLVRVYDTIKHWDNSDDFYYKKLKNKDISKVPNRHFRKLNNKGEIFLTEPGLYKIISGSRKGEKFSRWIFGEVIPDIRKTGRYELGVDLSLEQQQLDILSKFNRKHLTDSIQLTLTGKPTDKFMYANYTNMVYKKIFGKTANGLKKEYGVKDLRNYLLLNDLSNFALMVKYEEAQRVIIDRELNNGTKLNDIYRIVKEDVEPMVRIDRLDTAQEINDLLED